MYILVSTGEVLQRCVIIKSLSDDADSPTVTASLAVVTNDIVTS